MKPSTRLIDIALKGLKVLRPHYNCRQNNWSVYYFTTAGGWARLDSYCVTSFDSKELAETDIDRLIKLHPGKFMKEQDEDEIKKTVHRSLFLF